MTSCLFDDIVELSPDQTLRFEARAPENCRQDVSTKSRATGENRKGIRYQLYDIRSERVLWERWQEKGEDAPSQAWVGNDGDVVICASGKRRDHLLFVKRTGEIGLAVVVSSTPEEERVWSCGREENTTRTLDQLRAEHRRLKVASWRDASVRLTSGGPFWLFNSFHTFVSTHEGKFFSLRTAWGRRLIVNLDTQTLLADTDFSENLSSTLKEVERETALALLRTAKLTLGPQGYLADADGAIAVVIEQSLHEAICELRTLERREAIGSATSCVALGHDWWSHWDTTRTLTRHALRLLGEEPAFSGNYTFTNDYPWTDQILAPRFEGMATPSASDAFLNASKVKEGATVHWVLTNLGAPDDITQHFEEIAGGSEWAESWEYDGPDGSVRIEWSMPAQRIRGDESPSRHVAKVTHVEGWRDPRRLQSLLCSLS